MEFNSPKETEAIIPNVVQRIWEKDNPKELILREIALNGSVSGDSFVKVAYEQAYSDPAGNSHPGRVRILPLNSSFCFPEWAPHDKSRLERFKLKYRFWGTAANGTRQVYTMVELWTEQMMEIYINDELMFSEENRLGTIPFVHIPNTLVPSSPWGLADIQNITDLNRQYNETATQIADIVNYYAAPVTVIAGAKAKDLERGAKKIWAVPNENAKIENLELNDELVGPLQFLDKIKQWMHEITGTPESALGQLQPISNTSGVALTIMYTPAINKAREKHALYGYGLQKINEIALRTLALWEPDVLWWDPDTDTPLKEGQLRVLNPADPITYETSVQFQTPLPIDQLIALNEIMLKMQLGLESKRGALQILGEPYPDQKLQELMDELYEDALWQGGLDLLKTQITQLIMAITGMPGPGADGTAAPGQNQQSVASAGGPNVNSAPAAQPIGGATPTMTIGDDAKDLFAQLNSVANGGRLAQWRTPRGSTSDES